MKAIIYGNGKSRSEWDITQKFDDTVTWGCNRIYNDAKLDNIVAVDFHVQHLIYESGYAKNNKCWFGNWDIIPPNIDGVNIMPYPMMFDHYSKENGLDIYENKRHGFGYVFNGKFDGEHKGVWITHVEEKDMVTPIKEPVWWSAGTTAVNLACQQGFKEIYLMGFDLSANPLNNMYLEGKKEQMPSDPEDFCERLDWANQLKNTFGNFPDVQFIWVGASEQTIDFWEKSLVYGIYDDKYAPNKHGANSVTFQFNNLIHLTYDNIRRNICR